MQSLFQMEMEISTVCPIPVIFVLLMGTQTLK